MNLIHNICSESKITTTHRSWVNDLTLEILQGVVNCLMWNNAIQSPWLIFSWKKWPPFRMTSFCISIWISLEFISNGPSNNMSALVWVMAWRRTGDKPLHESMLTQFTDAFMRHWGQMSRIWWVSQGDMWWKIMIYILSPNQSCGNGNVTYILTVSKLWLPV